MFSTPILVVVGIVVFLLIALIAVFITKYRTAGPDEALIVTGSYLGNKNVHIDESGNRIKIVRGGGTFVLPVFQQAEPLSLLSSKLEVSTPEVYTEQGVPVMADGVSIIKIGGSISEIATAAEQFLGKAKEDRETEAREVLEGHLRSILGSMTVEEIYKNREKFSQEVQRVASQDLAKMGLIIVSFTIKDVRDKNGYLESLGKPRIAQVKRDADIATAEAEKETRIKRAEAHKDAQKAELERNTEIAEAEKMNQLKTAEYRREQDIAKAEAERVRIDGLAKAEAQRAQGESEAEIIRLKGLAEAEAKQKVAEAFEQFGQAAILDMIIKMLPEYAKQVASPLANIDKITVVDTGSNGENSGANKVTGYATNLMSSLQESLKASSGIDVKELIENFSGKGNVRQSLHELTDEIKQQNKKEDI